MNSKNERVILQFIKFAPAIFILTLSIIISITLYLNFEDAFNDEKELIQNEFVKTNKKLMKTQVEQVYSYIINEQEKTEARLKDSLKKRVYEAHKIAMNIYNENKHLNTATIKKMIKDALRTIRFNNGRGYFFIYSFDYECILLPVAKRLEGSNFYNFKDGKGKYLTRDIVKHVKKEKEGFMQWWYHKPNDMKNQYRKLGFNKHFEPFNWFIGTGEYYEDFEGDIKKRVLEHIHSQVYGKDEYIFVLDYKGKYLNHIRKEIIGLNALEAKDTRSHKTVLDAINIAKNEGSGYITYVQNRKPGSDLPTRKTSYVKGIQNWEWFIGKGFYEDNINASVIRQKELLENRFEKNQFKLLIITTILTLALLFFSIYVSKTLGLKFKKYREEIESNLEELTKQHNLMAHQSKMAAMGNMIGNIAHQWRQPLSLISTASTGMKMKKEMGVLSDEEFDENLDYINESTQYLSKTIDDFRNFFSTNKEKEYFNLNQTFDKTLNMISAQFKNHEIDIIKNTKDSEVFGTQSELIQVLINILNNSRDELIKIKDTRKLILIDSYEEDENLFIKIKDNAKGIDKKIIEHIFEPYFTTKHQSQGTGIGLYMSQEIIVKNMNGSIEIENINFTFEEIQYKGAQTIIKIPLHKK